MYFDPIHDPKNTITFFLEIRNITKPPVTVVTPIKSRSQPSYSARCVSHPDSPFNPETIVENPTVISPIAAWIVLNSLEPIPKPGMYQKSLPFTSTRKRKIKDSSASELVKLAYLLGFGIGSNDFFFHEAIIKEIKLVHFSP